MDDDSEDKLLDYMEPLMSEGGKIVDFHSNELFPERWFNLVIVLTTDNTVLYDRLKARNYNDAKITENVVCEIMQSVLEEAKSSYKEDIVVTLVNNTTDDLEDNITMICNWIEKYQSI